MSKSIFKLHSPFKPSGDQPEAISKLLQGLEKGIERQTLLGATGTGKTFTMANVIAKYNKPTLVIAHNKTLAAQLAQEFREFFGDAAVHYFVSYYDYYQPEAYIPVSDTYIEKDAQINKEIDRLRHATTEALLTRPDVIIVASVSCIYGLGSPEEYEKVNLKLEVGMKMDRLTLMKKLVQIHFERTNADLNPGQFRSIGSRLEFMPVSETLMYQVELSGGAISKITKVDPISSRIIKEEKRFFIFPAKHFITEDVKVKIALKNIKKELTEQLKKFKKEGKLLEAERLKRRTNYDLAMIREVGYCSGIENYSRHLSGKSEGEPPETLLSYFPKKSVATKIFPVGDPENRGPDKKQHPAIFHIEAYDIAHMSGKNMVGVLVVLKDGELAKHEYKKFKIRTQYNANDTGALKEVSERRFARTEWPYPDLLVVDGGVAQINIAKNVLATVNAKIPVVSVLKDERHKPKAIMGDKNFAQNYKRAILLANSEAHRFAITYHKKVREKSFLKIV